MTASTEASRVGLTIERLSVGYPGHRQQALDDVELTVEPGELVGVAGANGAGKSTLCLAAAGFVPRVVRARLGGRVEICGVDAATAGLLDLAGKVGICFSTPSLQLSSSKPTVREELAFGLENLAVPQSEMEPRIDHALEQLGIADLAERRPLDLSGGEQQRVAIASILVMGTGVIVLDEPTAQLDPAGTELIARAIAELAADGRAVLVAEHAAEVIAKADRCLALHDGRALGIGLPAAALAMTAAASAADAPTLVELAQLAGVADAEVWNEQRVADALRRWQPASESQPASAARAPGAAIIAPADGPTIELRGLVHRYGNGIEAVRGVDLRLVPGERTAIIGQNGSGKTTLIKHLNGLLRATAGEVLIDGRSVAGKPISELARSVGFVFQSPDDQLFSTRVDREVAFGPRNLGLDEAEVERRVRMASAAVGLAELGQTNPFDLQPSTRKLVALASVLAMEPPALVLDEPTSGQDATGRALVGRIIDECAAAGRIVLATTHDMELAAGHFDRIVVMRAGEVVLDGPPRIVFQQRHTELLASTGVRPPPAARVAHLLGLDDPPITGRELIAALAARTRSPS